MRGDGGNHHEKLGLMRILCASQFSIPDTAGTTPNPAGINTQARSRKPNRVGRTPDISHPLVSSILFQSSSPISVSLPSSQNTKLSHLSLLHHAMIMSSH